MILAAGLGTRMAPLTAERPKPLVPLMGKPLIDYAIERLVQGGVNFIVVNVHYKAEMLIAHLKARKDADLEIRICDETDAILDTGGAIAKALPFFEGQPFFTQNSDSLWVEGMEFENQLIVVVDGRKVYETTLGGDEDQKSIDQKGDPAVDQINLRLRNIRFKAKAGQHRLGVTFLARSFAESDARLTPLLPGGGEERVLRVK